MEVLKELDDEYYRFIRIGEEDDDTEMSGRFWNNPFDMYLTRGINFQPAA